MSSRSQTLKIDGNTINTRLSREPFLFRIHCVNIVCTTTNAPRTPLSIEVPLNKKIWGAFRRILFSPKKDTTNTGEPKSQTSWNRKFDYFSYRLVKNKDRSASPIHQCLGVLNKSLRQPILYSVRTTITIISSPPLLSLKTWKALSCSESLPKRIWIFPPD